MQTRIYGYKQEPKSSLQSHAKDLEIIMKSSGIHKLFPAHQETLCGAICGSCAVVFLQS